MPTKIVTLRFQEELYAAIIAAAKRNRMSRTEFIGRVMAAAVNVDPEIARKRTGHLWSIHRQPTKRPGPGKRKGGEA